MNPNLAVQDDVFSIDPVLENRAVRTRFHPIVSMRERSIIGLEALSQGIGPDEGPPIPPNVLFEAAAREGRTLELDRLCRETALPAFARRTNQETDYLLWLNFETSILDEVKGYTGRLYQTVIDSGLSPHRVVLEIVESKAKDTGCLAEFVDRCKTQGFLIALDDLGAGHSNLERVALLKPDIFKLDRSLIRDLDSEYHKREVVRSLNNLAVGVGALVVAEGVETEGEALAALDLGIHLHQGFFYAHPDHPHVRQVHQCGTRMEALAEKYRAGRLGRFSLRKDYYSDLGAAVDEIARRLIAGRDGFRPVLIESLKRDRRLECLYILKEDGLQTGPTYCHPDKLLRPDSPLFRPASDGADLSLKDYFLLVKAGLPRYISDPYISQASGNLCVTVSRVFHHKDGRWYVLCADYDCSENEAGC